jgi:hypothetical protein
MRVPPVAACYLWIGFNLKECFRIARLNSAQMESMSRKDRGDYYRCESHFDTLNAWLRGKGVNTQKPLHTLRKEYGSLINKAHGIHAASKALRHPDISVTNNFYTDSRARVTPRFGKLFGTKTRG